MLLTVDIGNSHTVIGLFQKNILRAHWRIKTDRKTTGDEIAVVLTGLLNGKSYTLDAINGLVLASVVPQTISSWMEFGNTIVDQPMIVNHQTDTGVRIAIDNPAEVGADRIVNAVAAYKKHPQTLIIVDFGTAITFDCVSQNGEYLGGAIAPGLGISLEALGQQTAQLPRVDISSPHHKAIGTNTVEAIKSGILLGYSSMVDGLIAQMSRELLPEKPMVIATGGMATLIARQSQAIEKVEPNLTLEGLALIYQRTASNG